MRSGACTVPQTLTAEAASVLKHSLALARRRGHAQVTPLHVAATLLAGGAGASRASLLRRACLRSQITNSTHHHHQPPHPLQCRALELCFNVALNRLPTAPSPLLHSQPSLSNALIAALKRAQAHQRRGCIEQQQHSSSNQAPLIAVKVQLEQLVISILDDPSVSRVMREAGFSSTAVKNSLEEAGVLSAPSVFHCYGASGGGVFSSPSSPGRDSHHLHQIHHHQSGGGVWPPHFFNPAASAAVFVSPPRKISPVVPDSDVGLVMEVLLRKKGRSNAAVIGDSTPAIEALVAELMRKVEGGEAPGELKAARFVRLHFSAVSMRLMQREEVEARVSDLKRKVEANFSAAASGGGGVIIYAGDLKWAVEGGSGSGGYSAVDHLVGEIGRLVGDYNRWDENSRWLAGETEGKGRVWVMGTANSETYLRCQMRLPSLETQWGLQVVSVPSATAAAPLDLTLRASSINDSRIFPENACSLLETKVPSSKEDEHKLSCCAECTSNYEKEVAFFKSGQQICQPSFLQPNCTTHTPQKDDLVELRKKWNRLCHSLHNRRPSEIHLNEFLGGGKAHSSYTSSHPWSAQSIADPNSIFFTPEHTPARLNDRAAATLPRFRRQQSCQIEFSFGQPNQKCESQVPRLDSLRDSPDKEVKITLALGNSLSSDPSREGLLQKPDACKLIEENVPWQSKTVPSIVRALMDENKLTKMESWLLIHGDDWVGRRRLALAIADSIFGSTDLLFHIDVRKKDDYGGYTHQEMLVKALVKHQKLVVLVENVDAADDHLMSFLAERFEYGKLCGESGTREGTNNSRVVYILSKGDSPVYENGKRFVSSVVSMKLQVNETSPFLGSHRSSDHKRKAEWDLVDKIKGPPNCNNRKNEKEFTRQLSSNTLDLNMRAEDGEDGGSQDTEGGYSPISSDLTREVMGGSSQGFLDMIDNSFVLNQSPGRDAQVRDDFLSRLRGGFREVYGSEGIGYFVVEQKVLEGIVLGSGSFLNSLFEKWLKEVFQTSLETIKIGDKEGKGVRLCFGGIEEKRLDDGFMGSSLPRKIQVSFMH